MGSDIDWKEEAKSHGTTWWEKELAELRAHIAELEAKNKRLKEVILKLSEIYHGVDEDTSPGQIFRGLGDLSKCALESE